jgi:hypothetical protein
MACRFRQLDAVSNDGVVTAVGQVTVNVFENGFHERRPTGVQSYQHPRRNVMACFALQQIKRLQNLSDTVQRKETGIHRNNRFGACFYRIEGEKADVGCAVHDNVIVTAFNRGDGLPKNVFTSNSAGKSLRCTTQQNVRGSQIQVL